MSLHAEVHESIEVNRSRASKLRSAFQDESGKDIENGIAEAQAHGHYSKSSTVDKDVGTIIILGNIATQITTQARNMDPFNRLSKTYLPNQDLHAKSSAKLRNVQAHSCIGNAPEDAVSNVTVNGTRIMETIMETKSYSATITLEILRQASVNRLEIWDSRHLGMAIPGMLLTFFSDDRLRGLMRLSAARLIECGNVEVFALAECPQDLERRIRWIDWHEEFERSLNFVSFQTYNVRMHTHRLHDIQKSERKGFYRQYISSNQLS